MGPTEQPPTLPPVPDQQSTDFAHNVAAVTCAVGFLAIVGGLVAGYFLHLTSTETLITILVSVLALLAPSPLQR